MSLIDDQLRLLSEAECEAMEADENDYGPEEDHAAALAARGRDRLLLHRRAVHRQARGGVSTGGWVTLWAQETAKAWRAYCQALRGISGRPDPDGLRPAARDRGLVQAFGTPEHVLPHCRRKISASWSRRSQYGDAPPKPRRAKRRGKKKR